jgi:hypothetical protein
MEDSYYKRHRENRLAYQMSYQKKNKDKQRIYFQSYWKRHREEILERNRLYRQARQQRLKRSATVFTRPPPVRRASFQRKVPCKTCGVMIRKSERKEHVVSPFHRSFVESPDDFCRIVFD